MNGEYKNTIDEKGRVMIPPRIREQLGTLTDLVITQSPDGSLWLFTKAEFEKLDAAVNYDPLSLFNQSSRILDMIVIAPARPAELDKAGRLMVPQQLREYAGLEGRTECVIIGSRTHVEILSAARHEELLAQYRTKVGQAGDELSRMRMAK